MNKIFALDSPLMQGLTTIANLMIVNILTIICCIPIFTIGAALSAMHYVLLKIARHEEGYIIKGYFHGFKENFKQATGEWMINLALFFVLGTEVYMMFSNRDLFPTWLRVIVTAALVLIFFLFQWLFPLQMHFVNPVKATLRNTVMMGLAFFPRTLLMGIVWAIPVAVIVLGSWRFLPLIFMFGLSFPGWLMAKIYSPAFKKFEPEDAEPVADEDFTLQGFQETQQAIHDTVSASANPDITTQDTVQENLTDNLSGQEDVSVSDESGTAGTTGTDAAAGPAGVSDASGAADTGAAESSCASDIPDPSGSNVQENGENG